MARKHLTTYLHDHLAGSVVAIELLRHLEAEHAGSDLASALTRLREDIQIDQDVLKSLIERAGGTKGTPRAAVAWLGEKAALLKLRLDDTAGGNFRLLEATEIVAVGIHGKRSLWLALSGVSSEVPELRGPDYGKLVALADEQRERIEAVRLDAARHALVE